MVTNTSLNLLKRTIAQARSRLVVPNNKIVKAGKVDLKPLNVKAKDASNHGAKND